MSARNGRGHAPLAQGVSWRLLLTAGPVPSTLAQASVLVASVFALAALASVAALASALHELWVCLLELGECLRLQGIDLLHRDDRGLAHRTAVAAAVVLAAALPALLPTETTPSEPRCRGRRGMLRCVGVATGGAAVVVAMKTASTSFLNSAGLGLRRAFGPRARLLMLRKAAFAMTVCRVRAVLELVALRRSDVDVVEAGAVKSFDELAVMRTIGRGRSAVLGVVGLALVRGVEVGSGESDVESDAQNSGAGEHREEC